MFGGHTFRMCAKSDASFLEWSKSTLTKVVMSSEKETDKKKDSCKGHTGYITEETSWSDSVQPRWDETLWDHREK